MNKLLILSLLSPCYYGYNKEYENLNEEEKAYIDYVDNCLNEQNKIFTDACIKSMLLILKLASKIGTEEELSNDEILFQKEVILNGFSQEDIDRIELFMYACIQIIGIYSEERIQERRNTKEKILSRKTKDNNNYNG